MSLRLRWAQSFMHFFRSLHLLAFLCSYLPSNATSHESPRSARPNMKNLRKTTNYLESIFTNIAVCLRWLREIVPVVVCQNHSLVALCDDFCLEEQFPVAIGDTVQKPKLKFRSIRTLCWPSLLPMEQILKYPEDLQVSR